MALCTYNGAAYLAEQLGSIQAQTRLPEEMVVCDDGSTDGTLAILEAFRAAAPFAVSIHQNAVNLGSTANFEQAIGLCTGDIVALSDQDDVWLPEKLAKITAQFDADPEIGLVFSDAEVVDDALQPLGLRLWEFARFNEERQALFRAGRAFESQLTHNVVTGATLAFRADLRALILPIPTDAYHIHDGWIALIAALVSRLAFLPERLVLYRQHAAQQLGVLHQERQRVLPGSHYRMHIKLLQAVGERLSRYQNLTGTDQRRRIAGLAAHAHHIQRRLDLPRSRVLRLPVIFQELLGGRYHRYSNGLPSLARDIFYPVEAS